MKILQATDLHLVSPGQLLYGLNPLERVTACLADMKRYHADADLCVLSGDLTDTGSLEAYGALKQALAQLPVAWRLIPGNHDDRKNMLQVFNDIPVDENGFVQSVYGHRDGICLFLDTLDQGQTWGYLCKKRLAWLDSQLKLAQNRPVYLFMHHPPFPTGIKEMDTISLHEPQGFFDLVETHKACIRHVFFGHLHRPISGAWRGIPFSTLHSTNHQVALDLVSTRVKGTHEPPHYAIALLDGQSSIVHYREFLYNEEAFEL